MASSRSIGVRNDRPREQLMAFGGGIHQGVANFTFGMRGKYLASDHITRFELKVRCHAGRNHFPGNWPPAPVRCPAQTKTLTVRAQNLYPHLLYEYPQDGKRVVGKTISVYMQVALMVKAATRLFLKILLVFILDIVFIS